MEHNSLSFVYDSESLCVEFVIYLNILKASNLLFRCCIVTLLLSFWCFHHLLQYQTQVLVMLIHDTGTYISLIFFKSSFVKTCKLLFQFRTHLTQKQIMGFYYVLVFLWTLGIV